MYRRRREQLVRPGVHAKPITDQRAKFSSFPRPEICHERGTMRYNGFPFPEEIFHPCFLLPEIAGSASNSWIFCSKNEKKCYLRRRRTVYDFHLALGTHISICLLISLGERPEQLQSCMTIINFRLGTPMARISLRLRSELFAGVLSLHQERAALTSTS
jgi:hypothetical protein